MTAKAETPAECKYKCAEDLGMHLKQARLNRLQYGLPFPGIIKSNADYEKISSNKARVKRLVRQWNRWCDQDYSQPVCE